MSGNQPTDDPTMLGFTWSPRTINSVLRQSSGDFWCVRDSFSELMGWPPGSEEWGRFIELPDGPADLERLINHLGLVWYDPEYPDHSKSLGQALDHPGIACYKFQQISMEHCMYQPHLRHFIDLPQQYQVIVDPEPELFQIIVDLRQLPHSKCLQCHV